MTNTILIRCPICKKELEVARDADDPPTAVIAEFECPDCLDPDKDEIQVYYYCMNGEAFEKKDWN